MTMEYQVHMAHNGVSLIKYVRPNRMVAFYRMAFDTCFWKIVVWITLVEYLTSADVIKIVGGMKLCRQARDRNVSVTCKQTMKE